VVVGTRGALAREAAERIIRLGQAAVARTGRVTIALAGGSTPRRLYALLASEPYRALMPWSRTLLFWGDERGVPPGRAQSNYRMVRETLLRHLPAQPAGVYRMAAEDPDPERAAAAYERQLRAAFRLGPGAVPRFDLIVLGLGADGHVASLFPGSPALSERARLVVPVYRERPGTHRLTLTLPVINAASAVLFLVSGRDKAAMLASVLRAPEPAAPVPARAVCPRDGTLTWLVDRAAASRLDAGGALR